MISGSTYVTPTTDRGIEATAMADINLVIERGRLFVRELVSTEQALMRVSPVLRQKLRRYRLAKLRTGLGTSGLTHAAATELVDEYRLFSLERR
jgi:hypothetical protein